MIKKITPLIFLLSTVFSSESTLYQAIASCKNLIAKRPEIISFTIGAIGGNLVGIAEKSPDQSGFNIPIICAYGTSFASLLIENNLFGTGDSAFLALPAFFMSWFGTHYIMNKLR